MAEPLLILDDFITPAYSVFREVVAPQRKAPLGAGAVQNRRQYARPLSRFRLRAPQETTQRSTNFWAFVAYCQGDVPFRFSGLQYGNLTANPFFVAFGDGSTRDLLLPHRNVSQVKVYVGSRGAPGTPVPIAYLNSAAGSLTLSSPPALNTYIRASYMCWYKCVMDVEGDVAMTEEFYYNDQFRYESIAILEVPF
jgi:hypothetical protein